MFYFILPQLVTTQAHSKYVPLNKFLQHRYYVPYCMFRGGVKVKCQVSVAKTLVQYVTLACFCYVDIGTYCCVYITLLQVRIAVVHNSNIGGCCWKGMLYHVGNIPYTKPNPKPITLKQKWCSIALKVVLILKIYSTISLKVLYSTFVKWCYVEP